MHNSKQIHEEIAHTFLTLNRDLLKSGFSTKELQHACLTSKTKYFSPCRIISVLVIAIVLSSLTGGSKVNVLQAITNYFLGIRCIVPNNYLIWEATRPLTNCDFCRDVTEATILYNVSKEDFAHFAYSSKPIVIKAAFLHWPAMKKFDFNFFKYLYGEISDSCTSVDEECQFLHFKSNFISVRDVFAMSEARISNKPGEKSWYVGWGNCHPEVLEKMRKYYPKPHFLPDDCEIPAKEYVFMGYDDGATMHLDFINRLMWQAQLKGSKTWNLAPPPECESVCSRVSFLVEPGDAVLVDTRIWYHGTTITPGEFSLSIQSEYG